MRRYLCGAAKITDVRLKHHLPNYGVFDEARIFTKGPLPEPIEFKGVTIGLPICEDLWQPGVASHLADLGRGDSHLAQWLALAAHGFVRTLRSLGRESP